MFGRTDGRKRTFHLDMDVPPKISFEKTCQIIEDFYTGDAQKIKIFELSQMRHAIVIVQYWAVFYPAKVHDMFQAAYYGICKCSQALLKSKKKEPSHVLNLVRQYIHREIMKFLDEDRPILKVEWRVLKNKTPVTGIQIQPHHALSNGSEKLFELLDLAKGRKERRALEMLSMGYSHQEICKELEIKEWAIRRMILRIRQDLS